MSLTRVAFSTGPVASMQGNVPIYHQNARTAITVRAFEPIRLGAGERNRTADLPLTRSMAYSRKSATRIDASRKCHHCTQNPGISGEVVPRPVPQRVPSGCHVKPPSEPPRVEL
jgi:hypothetical protein